MVVTREETFAASPKLARGKSQKGLRRMDTDKSHKSRASQSVRNSRGKLGTGTQSMTSIFEEKVEEEKPPHPFDAVFGSKTNKKIQDDYGDATIGLTFA